MIFCIVKSDIFQLPIHHCRDIVLSRPAAVEGPHCNIAVLGYKDAVCPGYGISPDRSGFVL